MTGKCSRFLEWSHFLAENRVTTPAFARACFSEKCSNCRRSPVIRGRRQAGAVLAHSEAAEISPKTG
jgi:hypothetical protein